MADVACNGCTACCRGPDRKLCLDREDDASQYETYRLPGDDRFYVQRNSNGDCIYLGDNGCTIYDRRPKVCQRFDCRDYIMNPRLPQNIRLEALKRLT